MELCSICQKEFDPTLGVFFDNRWFCRDCSIQYGQFENCSRCGRQVARWEYTTHNGKILCNECCDKVFIEERIARTCVVCKKEIIGPSVADPKGRKVCLKCYREQNLKPFGARMVVCSSCKKEVPADEVRYVHNKPVCEVCVERTRPFLVCSSCGSKIYEKPFGTPDNVLCAVCYSQLFPKEERCAICGKLLKAIKFVRRDGAILCLDCTKKESESG
ncbi:MAG: hypothetical protein NT130_03595 [Candidatus Micrarchaeota archaeon]|nr:hypothetical protein [Candidatus Micrarchaeota archaeon]